MTVSNFVSKINLKYNDVCDMNHVEEICKKDFGEFFGMDLALSVDIRG